MNLRNLSDNELIRHADNSVDSLTTTDLESELLRRFVEAQEQLANLDMVAEDLESYDFSKTKDIERFRGALKRGEDLGPDTEALLDVLADAGFDNPETLRKQLDRLAKFDDVLNDLVQPLTTLQSLATTE